MVTESKSELRARLKAARESLAPAERQRLGGLICTEFLQLPELAAARRVALYAATGAEVSTEALFAALRKRGVEVALPRVSADTRVLQFALATDFSKLVPGPFGIAEPTGAAVPVQTLELIALPGLGFDRNGVRLGYGAGYYDRTLADHGAFLVGLAYKFQLVEQIPASDHDVRLHAVVTQDEVVRTGFMRAGPSHTWKEAPSV